MTRSRRDPRAERAGAAVLGSTRPRFALGARQDGGRPRRDPRTEWHAQQVASPDRLRFDRLNRTASHTGAPVRPQPTEQAAPRLVVMDDPAFLIVVVPDAPGGRVTIHDRQLLGAARTLVGGTGAVIALVSRGCDDLGAVGADRIGELSNETAIYDPQERAATIAEALAALSPRHVLFAETAMGGDLARRVAVLTDEPLFSNVDAISATSLSRPARGRRIEQRCAPTRLISLAPDVAPPYAGDPREARPQPLITNKPAVMSTIIEACDISADPASVPLALADFVISAGNGLSDFKTFRRLVVSLGATPGASRVLCDAGVMPREAQVGASGTVLAATCYVALGIAGAPQHLQGIAGCEHVLAVNTDLHAAMIERAGLAIIQDAQLVMPALLAELLREAGTTA